MRLTWGIMATSTNGSTPGQQVRTVDLPGASPAWKGLTVPSIPPHIYYAVQGAR